MLNKKITQLRKYIDENWKDLLEYFEANFNATYLEVLLGLICLNLSSRNKDDYDLAKVKVSDFNEFYTVNYSDLAQELRICETKVRDSINKLKSPIHFWYTQNPQNTNGISTRKTRLVQTTTKDKIDKVSLNSFNEILTCLFNSSNKKPNLGAKVNIPSS